MSQSPIKNIEPLGFTWRTQDPFLFCVHHRDFYPKGTQELGPQASLSGRNLGNDFTVKDGFRMYHGEVVPGFPAHPHRGFETVTVVQEGLVDHSDSLGAAGRYGGGDVQWMTAGSGLQHAEMFPLIKQNEANPLELFQIWLNLPGRSKMVDPEFKMLWSEDIPVLEFKDSSGRGIRVIVYAGQFQATQAVAPASNSWAADSGNEVAIWNIILAPGAEWTLPSASNGLTRSLYYYDGAKLKLHDKEFPVGHGFDIESDQGLKISNGESESRLLLLQGKPINEPVAQYGPFVMNTRTEIQQAYLDYSQTQFGGWPWDRHDNTHGLERGRFARHADGREELPGS